MTEEEKKVAEEAEAELLASSSGPPPAQVGFLGIIGTIIKLLPVIAKYLPIILGILGGLGRFLNNFKPAPGAEIDQESLAKLIEEITEREVHRIVNENKDRIRVWVPSDEDIERNERLDELEEKLKRDQERRDREKAARDEMEQHLEDMKKSQD